VGEYAYAEAARSGEFRVIDAFVHDLRRTRRTSHALGHR
jgi:hypothetical protein